VDSLIIHQRNEVSLFKLKAMICLMMVQAVCKPALAQRVPLSEAQTEGQYQISVPVDLVVLPITVLNRKGRFVSGLNQDNFKVYENGQLQEIKLLVQEDIPVTVGLVLDNSGSMRPKLSEVNAAAMAFVQSSNPQDEMFVIKFNEKVVLGLQADVPFTNDEQELKEALTRNPPRGRTALYDAIAAGMEHLKQGSRNKKVLIVVSDGGDNSSLHTFSQVLQIAKRGQVIIYTIGLYDVLERERDLKALSLVAKLTGGEAFRPEGVDEVRSICLHIARSIRNQYTLEYVPSVRKHDGSYRTIRVTVQSPKYKGLIALTRTGYFAPLDNPRAAKERQSEVPWKLEKTN
jgi:Ca-activated chloride channel homolog